MHKHTQLDYHQNKNSFYSELCKESVNFYETSWLVNLSNASALIMNHLPDINWAGFYLWNGQKLKLGPFQGHPACLEISLGRGVCGLSALRREPVLVPNVDLFQDHIVCDSNSKSEIVLPLVDSYGKLIGVLDIDSPHIDRFSWADIQGLQKFLQILIQQTDWHHFRSF